MFQFPGLAPLAGSYGLPHSDITGSWAVCAYPVLFAAYHVLHRLRMPRHPPYTLNYFLSKIALISMIQIFLLEINFTLVALCQITF